MVNGTARLVVDLGNSSTRVKTYFGKTPKGSPRNRLSYLDNRYGKIPEEKLGNYLGSDVYTEENSRIFKHNDIIYCNGSVCNTEFGATTIRPTALEKKYESLVTKLTLINALCRGYEDIANFTNSDIESIDVDWELILLLPPDDIDAGASKLVELAKSITTIDFMMPELQKNVNIVSGTVYPEGFCALIGVLFESKGVIRPEYAYLVEEDTKTLICDIGAGTTDFMLAEGANVISSTRFTKEIGGNNVHQRVRRLLKDEGVVLNDRIVRKGTETGTVKSGAKVYDITPQINRAKSEVSNQLVDAVQEFFEDNMLPVQSINNLLICGGGAESSDNPDIEPIANYIKEYMLRLSPNIHLVELPNIVINGEESKASPRLLNIIGAGILAE